MALQAVAGNVVYSTVPHEYACADGSIRLDLEIQIPKPEKRHRPRPNEPAPVLIPRSMNSLLSMVFLKPKFPEPEYFQSVDCVGLPMFFTAAECGHIIDFADCQGFRTQKRERVFLQWCDIIDSSFADAIWQSCGLKWFLSGIVIDGMVPCGLNDIVRIQKYVPGCHFDRHKDQQIETSNGRISKYSLRVFLNGKEERWFEGGQSAFHLPFRKEPVVFEPEGGLALLYPQGERCTVQEEAEVTIGCKYVLRADVLFCRPEDQRAVDCSEF